MCRTTAIFSTLNLFYILIIFQSCLLKMEVVKVEAVRPSEGCYRNRLPNNPKFRPGQTTKVKKKVKGTPKRTHSITLPSTYDEDVVLEDPPPLLLFFHGYGGSHKSCGERCTVEAPDKGFVTVTMTGYGKKGTGGWNSWQFYGSSSSADGGEYDMTTCDPNNVYGNYCRKFKECDCQQSDGCWWTTCHDSVKQVIQILNMVEKKICIDLDRIWASGCSNGAMFTYELARDARTAGRIRGIAPIVGLPHWGYSTGPMVEGISYFGMFGVNDNIVPPVTNTDIPNMSQENQGWRYTAYNKTVADWTVGNGCDGDGQTPLIENEYNTTDYGFFDCVQGCEEAKNTSHVVSCLFQGGHDCYKNRIPWEPMFEFILSQN